MSWKVRVLMQNDHRNLTYEDENTAILIWVARLVSRAISMVQFYELDCAFRAIQPYSCFVPL
jgi:hypothetical protein